MKPGFFFHLCSGQGYVEKAEHLRYIQEVKEIYTKRKEIINCVFADTKEKDCMHWTTLRGILKGGFWRR